jgi:Fic family protein
LLFELDPRESTSERDPANDHREVFNYRRALNHGVSSELPLSLRLLKDLHQTLLDGVRGKDRAPGDFRRIQVGIGSGGRFIPPPPEQILPCLDALEKYFHAEQRPFDPLVDCFLVHYQFEAIHPFIDGNGRVGRLLLAIMLHQRCGLSKPWIYMSEFFEAHRDDYIAHLFNVSAKGDWSSWIEFCLQGTIQQAKEAISRCQRLLAVRDEFKRKLSQVGGSVRLADIVEDFFHSPFVRIADLPKRQGITYPTAKADIERLVEAGILKELSITRPKTYYAPDIFNVAYEKLNDDELT